MIEKKNIEKVYEKFIEDVEPTKELQKIYDDITQRLIRLKEDLSDGQVVELEDIEEKFSKIHNIENREAFIKGFSIATNLILESRE